ncbi:MAG: DUF1640 domain-containing protein [Methylococcaceae bacterium]|nr:MAG: DUF1640 domain-containing protein [Methylococcaceae bacterium]
MTAITFDTLKFVETLKQAGVHEEQAKGIATAFKDASGEAELATRQDIRELETRIRETELRLEAKISDSKAELIRWVVGVGMLQMTLIAALLLRLVPN